jgi:membrane-bound ClpP family serine protease
MDWSALFIASFLLLLATLALVAELFVVSFGALALVSLGLAIAAMVYAFTASALVGWTFVVIAPLLGGLIVSRGLRALQRSRLVPKAEISDDAGYHHVAAALGIAIGSQGRLVTPARPTARARFAGGECDVVVDGSAETGTAITVQRIAGATIYVSSTSRSSVPSIH